MVIPLDTYLIIYYNKLQLVTYQASDDSQNLISQGSVQVCVNTFPTYANSAADDFEHILSTYRKSL